MRQHGPNPQQDCGAGGFDWGEAEIKILSISMWGRIAFAPF
jgi:hypothetical protein